MAVTSPLAPLSPPRAVGRGNLCAPVMPQNNLRVLPERIHNQTHARIVCGADAQMRRHMLHLFWLLNKLSKIQQN